ncbi:transcriptional regulator, LysR family [Rhizobiales bacterium GAS188]|nr:transcriptional regulator, LysR family [Rhizobiales bacterium GAS188]
MQRKPARGAPHLERGAADVVSELLWDDLRIFLGCAAHGSLRRAADTLGVSASTIARALDRLEKTVGYRLFVRYQEGLKLTDDARLMLEEVRAMERASFSIARRSSVGQDPLKGIVRVSITEGLGTYWVLPQLLPFAQAHRFLTVDLRCTMDSTDVARLEADISIQFNKPTNPDLYAVRLGHLHTFPFASQEYARQFGVPRSLEEARQHRFIQQVSPLLPDGAYERSLQVESLEGMIALRTNTSSAVLYAIERDAGIGWLPSYALVFGGRFVPVEIGIVQSLEIWMTYHPDIRKADRYMVVIELLRKLFDPRRFPCFREEFIHPLDLVPMMADVAETHGGRGFLAADPAGQSSGTLTPAGAPRDRKSLQESPTKGLGQQHAP